jgi:hypothetical protein
VPLFFDQTDYRFRNDDGTHITATWKAATNTDISVDVGAGNAQLRVRLAVQYVAVIGDTFAARLFVSKNGGAYSQVGAATSNVKAANSANLTDDATTTQQITAFAYTAGRVDDVDGTTTATGIIVATGGTEFEFMIELITADLAYGDTLDFRLYQAGSAIVSYSRTARITVINASPLPVHAPATRSLLHAEAPIGERNVLYILAPLADESGEVLTDQAGETLVAYGETPVTILHTMSTDTLLHAEE